MQYLYYSVTLYDKLFCRVMSGGDRYSMQRASWRVRILDFPKGSWGLLVRELQLRVTPVGSIHFVWGQAKFR